MRHRKRLQMTGLFFVCTILADALEGFRPKKWAIL